MEYRVEELAAAAGVKVDTVRFYQSKRLLAPPRREGRTAVYAESHLERLRRIRHYQAQGLTLAVIKRLVESPPTSKSDALLRAVVDEADEPSMTRAELAARSGLPDPLLASLEAMDLLTALPGNGEERRYGKSDLQMARSGMEILRQGFPLDELFELATRHAHSVEQTVDAAIDLFDRFARGKQEAGAGEVAESFQRLLPAVTTLVAAHFQRTLLSRALRRLRQRGEHGALEAAVAAVESGRVEVTWR